MKKSKLTFLTLALLSLAVNAQKYVPFPTKNATWSINLLARCYGDPSPIGTPQLTNFALTGDTAIINKIVYFKVSDKGFIRESNKRIYYIGKDFTGYYHNDETLLYDFNTKIGDTIKHNPTSMFFYSVIKDIDSIKINTEYRKRYKVTDQSKSEDYIIEGIGSVGIGLLGNINDHIPTCGGKYSWEHICFTENDTIRYLNPTFRECGSNRPYHPFPTKNATWNTYFSDSNGGKSLGQYTLTGDTTIDATSYHKLSRNIGTIEQPKYKIAGFIQEVNKRILYHGEPFTGPYASKDCVLYDFTKGVGDTIYHEGNKYNYSVITKTDETVINGEVRKRYTVTDPMHREDTIIEGIGSVKWGLLNNISKIALCGCSNNWEHICYSENGKAIYLNPEFTECVPAGLATSVTQPEVYSTITISPNPVTDFIHVDNLPENGDFYLKVMDIAGKTILTKSVSANNSTINLNIPSGIHFVIISNSAGQNIKTQKIIKL